jgi:hypothetical protein
LSLGPYHDELYEQVIPLHGPDPDGLARDLVGAWCHGIVEVDDLVRDTEKGPGWGQILDVEDAPVKGLAWLGQLAGVTLRPRKITEGRRNLLDNPSAEVSTSGMSGSGGTISRVASAATDHGQYAFRIVRTGAVAASATWSTAVTVKPATEYVFSLTVLSADQNVYLSIDWTGPGPSFTTNSSLDIAHASATPGRRVFRTVSPSFAATARVELVLQGTTAGDAADFDSAVFEMGPSDGDYFDGDTAGAVWLGTPHLSASAFRSVESDDEWATYARSALREQNGKRRGTRRAMVNAAQDTLIGARYANVLERVGGNAYALTLVTRPSETPDPARTYAAALTQKPLGMSLTHTLVEGAIIDEGTRSIDTSTGTIDTATLGDVAD